MLQNILPIIKTDMDPTDGYLFSHESVINQINSLFDRLKKVNDSDLISEIAKKITSIHFPPMCTDFKRCIISVIDNLQLSEELRQSIKILASQIDKFVGEGDTHRELDQRREEI